MAISFSQQIDKEMNALKSEISKAVTKASLDAWQAGVDKSPRDTGTLQSGWKLSRTRRGQYVPVYGPKPKPKKPKFSFRATKDKRVYLWNNVTYAYYVNEGLGAGSRKAHKMIEKAGQVFESSLQREFNKIK